MVDARLLSGVEVLVAVIETGSSPGSRTRRWHSPARVNLHIPISIRCDE
jgi:hypothetical protein